MRNTRFVSALNEVFEARAEEYMNSVDNKNDHVFSEEFNKKMRRITRVSSDHFRLLHIEPHVLVNTLSICAVIAIIIFVGTLNFRNIGEYDSIGNGRDTYIDIDENYSVLDSSLAEQLEMRSKPLNTVITDYRQDTMNTNYHATFDDKYCYLFSGVGYWGDPFSEQALQYYTIDLQSGEIVSMCDTPGCTHDINLYPDCINNRDYFNNATAVGDAIWYVGYDNCNKIIELKNGSEAIVWENTYCTEFEENTYQETATQKYIISKFYVDDDYIYLFGPSYTYRIDRKTMKAEDPINISDDAGIWSPVFYDGKVYIGDDLNELFVFDYDTSEINKISDKNRGYNIYDGKIYTMRSETDMEMPEYDDYKVGNDEVWVIDIDAYIAACEAYEESIVYTLYRTDMDYTNEEKVLDGCAFYQIIDGRIYYYGATSKDRNILRCYDIETGDDKVIYDNWAAVSLIYTSEHIDRIFVLGYAFTEGHEDDEYKVTTNTGYLNSKIISFRRDGSDLWTATIDGSDTIA